MNNMALSSIPALAAGDLARAAGLEASNSRDARKTAEAAKDFEAVLLNKIMEAMERTIPKSGLLDGGATEQIRSMFWMHLADELADNGGLGLWKDIQRQMQQRTGKYTGAEKLEAPSQVEQVL
ncbi:MAG: rod-binding protein [Planctomycetes bacterium]|nr:rod-binding protein [Planctomycetota bacterium]